MAIILVQHLDPTHASMTVELLASHTSAEVQQATDGMKVEQNKLYVIPPGFYLTFRQGSLHLTQPEARDGARLPFDFLLNSLAEEYGERCIALVLSGTGTDGSIGLTAIKNSHGFIVAQDPGEAAYAGVPTSAIATGLVDRVLPVSEIMSFIRSRTEQHVSLNCN